LLVHRDLDSLGNREFDRMRFAESKRHNLALEFGAVTDANDIQILLETQRDAVNGIGDESARETVQGAVVLGVAKRGQHAVFLLKRDAGRQRDSKLALRALHVDLSALQSDFHACRNWNWFASDT